MAETSTPTIYYSIDKTDPKYVEYVENMVALLHQQMQDSKICIADCKNKNTGEIRPVICVLVKEGILPIATMFNPDEVVIDSVEPINYSE